MTKYKFRHNKFYTKNYIQPFLFCYFTSSLSRKKFQTQSSLTKRSKVSRIHKVPNESTSLSPIQKASPYRCRFILAWPSPIHFLPVCRDASARNGSRLTITDSFLASPSRCFSSQGFAPHHRRFASRRSVATLQLATMSFALSATILATLQSFTPSATLHLPPSRQLFASHPTSDSSPSDFFFFFLLS